MLVVCLIDNAYNKKESTSDSRYNSYSLRYKKLAIELLISSHNSSNEGIQYNKEEDNIIELSITGYHHNDRDGRVCHDMESHRRSLNNY